MDIENFTPIKLNVGNILSVPAPRLPANIGNSREDPFKMDTDTTHSKFVKNFFSFPYDITINRSHKILYNIIYIKLRFTTNTF